LWNEVLALFEFLAPPAWALIGSVHIARCHHPKVFELYEAGGYPAWRADVAAGYHRPAAAILTGDNGDLGLLQSPAGRRGSPRLPRHSTASPSAIARCRRRRCPHLACSAVAAGPP
jgi:hypothetical protein